MLLKVLLVLKTGNFSDWIGSRVACNAPVSRVGGGGSGEGGARVSNDWCIIFAGWRVNQVGFEGFHPQKVEKFFPVLIFLMFTRWYLVWFFIWVREIKIQKISLALPFFPASGVTSTGLTAYTNQSKYRQIEGLFLHNLFTRSVNSSQMAAAAYLTIFEAWQGFSR